MVVDLHFEAILGGEGLKKIKKDPAEPTVN